MADEASPLNHSLHQRGEELAQYKKPNDFAKISIMLIAGALYICGTLWNSYCVSSFITAHSHWAVGIAVAMAALVAQLLLLFGIPMSLVCIGPLLGVAAFTMASPFLLLAVTLSAIGGVGLTWYFALAL